MIQQKKYQKAAKATNPYVVQRVMSASPDQLIAYIYEAGITACKGKDRAKALKAVQSLISSLNFDHDKEIAYTFYRVYRYINQIIIKGKFEEAQTMLNDLKQSWTSAMKVH
jgi:flagellin-specific chaperone FliS